MSVQQAVLGLLLERRGYGYDLLRRLDEGLGELWQLNHSTVYAALDQLEAAGLARGERRDQGAAGGGRVARRDARVVYEPTEAGAAAFRSWIERPSASLKPIRSELSLKLVSAGREDLPALLATLDHEEQMVRRALSRLRAEDDAEADALTADDWPQRARALVRAGALHRLDGELAWLQTVREAMVDALTLTPSCEAQ